MRDSGETCYTSEIKYQTEASGNMAQNKKKEPPPVDNVISDQTGQFDLRFVLWRHFCSTNNIPVESLPSQLNDEQKEKWEELKASRLRSPGQKET